MICMVQLMPLPSHYLLLHKNPRTVYVSVVGSWLISDVLKSGH